MNNRRVAQIFDALADTLNIHGTEYHRIRAYHHASEGIGAPREPLAEIWCRGEVEAIHGVGTTLSAEMDGLVRTGELAAYHQWESEVPQGVVDVLQVTGIGLQTAARFWKELGVETTESLEVKAIPRRLDFNEVRIRPAINLGVQLAITSDAHVVGGSGLPKFGVTTARRGRATRADLGNTRSFEGLPDWAARISD